MKLNLRKMSVTVSIVLINLMVVFPSSSYAQCLPSMTFSGEGANNEFGWSVSGAGDVDGDGYDDLIIGAPFNSAAGSNAGRAYVYSGQTEALLYTFTGEAAGDNFGWSVSGAGDVNADGFADIIVGARENDAGGANSGRAYVYSGSAGTLLYTFTGEAAHNAFGYSVSGAGDIDNDGRSDLIVGAFGYPSGSENTGKVYVYSGQSGGLLHTFTGLATDDFFGYSVSGAGDVNNDAHADVIVGAIGNATGGSFAGQAYVYSGQTGALLHTFTGESTNDEFGHSVSGAGDVDLDGYADLIVGSHWNDAGGVDAGRAYVFSGQFGTLLYSFTGEAAMDEFGYSVSGAGDVDNDGHADLIVGAYGNSFNGNYAGRAYVYSGQTGNLMQTSSGDAAYDYHGYSVSGAGHVDNDILADVIVGANRNDAGGNDAGGAYVFLPSDNCAGCCDTAGDANNSGSLTIGDVTFLIARIFSGGPPPDCCEEGDADGSGSITIADATYLIARIFAGAAAPICGPNGMSCGSE